MSQKRESSRHQSFLTSDAQSGSGAHFELNHTSAAVSPVGPAACDAAHLAHPPGVGHKLLGDEQSQNEKPQQDESNVLVTVLMPCLNEARTLAACIQQAHAGCRAALAQRGATAHAASGRNAGGEEASSSPKAEQSAQDELSYEILIADNGSTDGSPDIAIANGARVVHVERKGYGAALRGGIAAARGKYIVMGDSDCSYDFGEVPRFLEKLEEGYDLVMGNRFAGGIMPGAMPWHHRYIGNPLLSGLGRLLFRTPCKDWHCGLRAFDREKVVELGLKSQGMEFASELVIQVTKAKLRISELDVRLYPDERKRAPHLRSFRDGFRHLYLMLCLRFRSP